MTTPTQQRHDIHKYRETVKCTEYNWIDWSDVIESVLRERGLWAVTAGFDLVPTTPVTTASPEDEAKYKASLTLFEDRSYAARNQILQNLSPEIRNRVRHKKNARGVWQALKDEFESSDPENVDIVRRRYDNFTLASDMTISTYIDALVDLRERLDRMQDPISNSAFAARLLRNLPPTWSETARTIRQITSKPEVVMQKLKLEEAARQNEQSFLNPHRLDSLTGQALIGHRFGDQSLSSPPTPPPSTPTSNPTYPFPTSISCKCGHQIVICGNCYSPGHTKENCFKRGGGKEGQWTARNVKKGGRANTASPDATGATASTTSAAASTSTVAQVNVSLTISPAAFNALPAHDDRWILDSGCTSSMTHRKDWLIDFTPITPTRFKSANGVFYVTGRGKISTTFHRPNTSPVNITLNEVFYSTEISASLLSISAITAKGAKVTFVEEGGAEISLKGKIIGYAKRSGSLFVADCTTHTPETTIPSSLAVISTSNRGIDLSLLHSRLGHLNYQSILALLRSQSVLDIPVVKSLTVPKACVSCLHGKQSRAPFPSSTTILSRPLEIIATDLMGPFSPSLGGSIYAQPIIDLFSGYVKVYYLKDKTATSTLSNLAHFIHRAERQTGFKVLVGRTDGGGEFVNELWQTYFADHGIIHQTTSPHTPQQNGGSERGNRTLQEGELTLRNDAQLDTRFWAEAMDATAYVRNRIPKARLGGDTPYFRFYGIVPSISHLRTFGCRAFVKVPDALRRKGEFKTVPAIFIGYYEDSKAFKCWDPISRRTLKSRDVIFDEGGVQERLTVTNAASDDDDSTFTPPVDLSPPISSPTPIISSPPSVSDLTSISSLSSVTPSSQSNPSTLSDVSSIPSCQSSPTLEFTRRPETLAKGDELQPWNIPNSTYGRGQPRRANLVDSDNVIDSEDNMALAVLADDEPKTYGEAFRGVNREKWIEAMTKEIRQLEDMGTWELEDLPPGRKAIGTRWVYHIKRDANGQILKFKARITAQGFAEIAGVDFFETYSPTPDWAALRALLATAIAHDLELRHIDVVCAFLQAPLKKRFMFDNRKVLSTLPSPRKSIDSRRHSTVSNKLVALGIYAFVIFLCRLGFTALVSAATFYFKVVDGKRTVVGWHVDDGLLTCTRGFMRVILKLFEQGPFEITDLGVPTLLLGSKLECNDEEGWIKMSQPSYIDTLVNRFNLNDSSPVGSPLDSNIILVARPISEGPDPLMKSIPYLAGVGSINWCAVSTRPDIAFAASKLASFCANPTYQHWEALLHVVRYLKSTRELGLVFRKDGGGLVGFSDADWAGDRDDRKSYSGFVFTLAGAPISWKARKQSLIALSSMESEFYAATLATQEAIWLRKFLNEIGFPVPPIPLSIDNASCEAFIRNDVAHARTKHIDTKFHFVRQSFNNHEISLLHVAGTANPADIFTKALSPAKHKFALSLLGMSV